MEIVHNRVKVRFVIILSRIWEKKNIDYFNTEVHVHATFSPCILTFIDNALDEHGPINKDRET